MISCWYCMVAPHSPEPSIDDRSDTEGSFRSAGVEEVRHKPGLGSWRPACQRAGGGWSRLTPPPHWPQAGSRRSGSSVSLLGTFATVRHWELFAIRTTAARLLTPTAVAGMAVMPMDGRVGAADAGPGRETPWHLRSWSTRSSRWRPPCALDGSVLPCHGNAVG